MVVKLPDWKRFSSKLHDLGMFGRKLPDWRRFRVVYLTGEVLVVNLPDLGRIVSMLSDWGTFGS